MPRVRINAKTSSATATTTPSISVRKSSSHLDCYNFLSPHEYCAETIGLQAFLLRKSVGDINFSDVLDEAGELTDPEKRADNIVALLEKRRNDLPDIDASIEKCLMLNRLITYIQKDKNHFAAILSHVQRDMNTKMTDNQIKQTVLYPTDFRQLEADFTKRKEAQEKRRLFYVSHEEAKKPTNLIYLQNRTTDYLSALLDDKLKFRRELRDAGPQEMTNILKHSFMITDQPHYGVNPVLIYDRIGPGLYRMKGTVVIVSLLHDFMERHPGVLQLYDIEISLYPPSLNYQLEQPRSISWHTCHLQSCPGVKPQKMQYAELTFITIRQTRADDSRVHFAQLLHKLEFTIRYHIELNDNRRAPIGSMILQSLSFAIGAHSKQIPQLLTRVILDDIVTFTKPHLYDIGTIRSYVLSYFVHRTGVEPNLYTQTFLDQELTKALNKRRNFPTFEDIYMDFLVPFVEQIEFMAKHPLLAMLYADKFLVGPCNGADTTEQMKRSANIDSDKLALRYNSIRVNYTTVAGKSVLGRNIQPDPCTVRVDIYDSSRKMIKFYTLDHDKVCIELSKLARTACSEKDDSILVLSDIYGQTNDTAYKSFSALKHYYHDRLQTISRTNEDYRPITNLKQNIADDDGDRIFDEYISPPTSDVPITSDNQNTGTSQYDDHRLTTDGNQGTSDNVLSLSKEDLIEHIRSNPEFYADLIKQLCLCQLSKTEQPQTAPVLTLNQTNNENQADSHSMDEMSDAAEQCSTQSEILQATDSDFDQLDTDLSEFLTRDLMPETSVIPQFQSPFDELASDIHPS